MSSFTNTLHTHTPKNALKATHSAKNGPQMDLIDEEKDCRGTKHSSFRAVVVPSSSGFFGLR